MTNPAPALSSLDDNTMLRLAREIAMDIRPLDEILSALEITQTEWAALQRSVTFQGYLRRFVEEWQSATNTRERVMLKSLAFVEEALPEFYARAHDASEGLNHKVEVLKTIARIAELGMGSSRNAGGGQGGERFSVTINLGNDQTLKIEHDFNRSSYGSFDEAMNDDLIEGDVL